MHACMYVYMHACMYALNTDPNWQAKAFTDIFLNIMSNFIPNDTKIFVPHDPPWITKSLKTTLNKKNRFFRNYKMHGYKLLIKFGLTPFVSNVNKLLNLPN